MEKGEEGCPGPTRFLYSDGKRQAERQTDKQTNRQTDEQMVREREGQADR